VEEFVVGRRIAAITEERGEDEEARRLRQARAGDAEAFARLAACHLTLIRSVIRRLLPDPNDTEDAVQETLLRAFRSVRAFRGEASARTWLLRIAVNVARTHRGEPWRRRIALVEDPSRLGGGGADARLLAEAAMVRDAEERALHQALAALPERLRLPILLHFFDGLSGAEIAAVLGWNPSTVWSRIYAGCRALRKTLEEDAAF
jgi:RNA polymerase sigma-70 factor (ECF subfamily)